MIGTYQMNACLKMILASLFPNILSSSYPPSLLMWFVIQFFHCCVKIPGKNQFKEVNTYFES